MTIHWDDLEILGAVDRLEDEGRAYMLSGEDLLQAIAAGRGVEDANRHGLARMLLMLRNGSPRYLAFDQQQWPNIVAPQPQEHACLQSLWHFELTPGGRDRARARVVFEGLPDPDQDDGRPIPALLLDHIAGMLAEYYTGPQIPKFLHDAGLAEDRGVQVPDLRDSKQEYVSNLLALIESGTPELRRVLRRFMARFVTGGFTPVPDASEQQWLMGELAKAGWYVEGDTIVIGARRQTLVPVDSEELVELEAPATLAGLDRSIVEAAEALWNDGHRREAIQRAATAVLNQVRTQSGLDLDGKPLMAQAFSPEAPRIVVADLRTENGRNLQAGTHLIAMGSVAAIRNPVSHTLADHDEEQARELLAVLSFIARRLDDARGAPPVWRGGS